MLQGFLPGCWFVGHKFLRGVKSQDFYHFPPDLHCKVSRFPSVNLPRASYFKPTAQKPITMSRDLFRSRPRCSRHRCPPWSPRCPGTIRAAPRHRHGHGDGHHPDCCSDAAATWQGEKMGLYAIEMMILIFWISCRFALMVGEDDHVFVSSISRSITQSLSPHRKD